MIFDKHGHFGRKLKKIDRKNHLKCKTNITRKYLREADRVSEFDQKGTKRVKNGHFRPK